jgi:hypothetical protein
VTGVPLASLDVEQVPHKRRNNRGRPLLTRRATTFFLHVTFPTQKVGRLLTNIKFNAFVAAVMELECDGETLCAAETVEEVVALGVGVTPKAKVCRVVSYVRG